MDVFTAHQQLIADYAGFTSGFTEIHDRRIRDHVAERSRAGDQWPDPFLALNPGFASGGSIGELVASGVLHPECEKIFRAGKAGGGDGHPIDLHQHQRDAIETAATGVSYVLTTGTGSGKSLGYIVPIVDAVLRSRADGTYAEGLKAIIVYPMNALANSQRGELEKFLEYGYPSGAPVTFRRYTGQDRDSDRREILSHPPDILLTNYVMLELLLVRPEERRRLILASRGLRFLVLDELHTYRGRQGADVAMLVRRVRDACGSAAVQCVGTSATISTEGNERQRREAVAGVASKLFGVPVGLSEVIGETLRRSIAGDVDPRSLTTRIVKEPSPVTPADFIHDPLASWVERRFGLGVEDGRLVRPQPDTVPAAAAVLAADTGLDETVCRVAIENTLQLGANLPDPRTGRPIFAFRLHQFLSKGDNVHLSVEAEDRRHITSRYQTTAPGDEQKVLIPAAFCRECGQEYLAVGRAEESGVVRYTPRRDHDGGDPTTAGYLFVSSELPWPETVNSAIVEGRLPETWLVTETGGHTGVAARRRRLLPRPVSVGVDGVEVAAPEGTRCAFVPGAFAFCLRCRVSYEQLRSSDFGKLASLSAEGRSSATSVLTASVIRSLRQQPAVKTGARSCSHSPTTGRTPACRPVTSTTSCRSLSCAVPCTEPCSMPRTASPTRSSRSASSTLSASISPISPVIAKPGSAPSAKPGKPFARSSDTGSSSTWNAAGGSPCPTWSRPACCASSTPISRTSRPPTTCGRVGTSR